MDAAGWDERYTGFEVGPSVGPTAWVADVASSLTPGRALDIGAGDGRHALWLAKQGWRVTAVDFSAVGLQRLGDMARAELPETAGTLELVQADVTQYRPQPGAYDLVLIAYMHLLPPLRRALIATAAASLTVDGVLLVIGHDRVSAGRGIGGPQDPDLLWTTEEIEADIATTTLELVSSEPVARLVSTDEGDREAIDTALAARQP